MAEGSLCIQVTWSAYKGQSWRSETSFARIHFLFLKYVPCFDFINRIHFAPFKKLRIRVPRIGPLVTSEGSRAWETGREGAHCGRSATVLSVGRVWGVSCCAVCPEQSSLLRIFSLLRNDFPGRIPRPYSLFHFPVSLITLIPTRYPFVCFLVWQLSWSVSPKQCHSPEGQAFSVYPIGLSSDWDGGRHIVNGQQMFTGLSTLVLERQNQNVLLST